ncbi:hypothetical protein ZWY2020_049746 [Hordeum vulgare]|nr:hypothetical protein ZWY2020_049746 [Hordeum vulgare]
MAAASSSTASAYRSRFGDTTQTKVFVGGLAWETPSEGLRQHFEQYGDILEAVVTFREAEAARRAVEDPNPTITGRRANCNIASLGPPRPAQPRGRPSPGGYWQQGPQYYIASPRAHPQQQQQQQQQMGLMLSPGHGPAIYHHHHPSQQYGYGYWCPPDYQYQQAMMSPRAAELLCSAVCRAGVADSATALPSVRGYVLAPTPRAAVLSPVAQQVAAGSLSLLPPNATDMQSAGGQASSAAAPTNANNAQQQGA